MRAGDVRLLRPEELPSWWDPGIDERPATWKALHHLIRLLALGGAVAAAAPTAALARADVARDLCYRLYSVCERRRFVTESLAYNGLVTELARDQPSRQERKREAGRDARR